MSVDTKGVVLTPCKDVMLVSEIVARSLDELIVSERNIRAAGPHSRVWKQFQTCAVRLIPHLKMAQFAFLFRNDERVLTLHFGCDCDHEDLAPKSLSFSIGAFGESELFAKTALHALSILGPAYIDANDSDEVDLEPLEEFTPTVMNLIALGYWQETQLEDWVERFDAGLVGRGKRFEEFFGVEEAWVRKQLADEDFKARWYAIMARARNIAYPAIDFMTDFHQRSAA